MNGYFHPSDLDDQRDPLPRDFCGICMRHWVQCSCDPDDPDMHRRIAIERALRAGDDATALDLIEEGR